jgi:hypothetical protein
MANTVKHALQDLARESGSDWLGQMAVWLGNLDGEVETGIPGRYYARQANGQVITVKNAALVPPLFDLHVLVRRSRIQPNIWQITEVIEDYTTPAGGGLISHHHEQHEEAGSDRLSLDRKQIKQLTCRVSGTWEVAVFGAVVATASGVAIIENQLLDLSSYVVATGAKYVSIETDDEGELSLNEGTPFSSPEVGTELDIPAPDPGKYILAYVLFYEGQTELSDENIRVIMPLPLVGKTSGIQISEAAADSPIAGDLWGFWDTVDEELKAIEWEALRLLFMDVAPAHEHGLARWNGAAGQTTFDLPDLASQVESVMINGLEEDPFVYSLSSDGSQIVLDTGLASSSTVTAHYILLST